MFVLFFEQYEGQNFSWSSDKIYARFPFQVFPKTNTTAHQLPVNKLSDKLKINVAMAGYTEVFTFSLCSRADISTSLGEANEEDSVSKAVQISNPATLEFQV